MPNVCLYLQDRVFSYQKLPSYGKVKKRNPVLFTSFIREFDASNIDILMEQMVRLA